MPEIISSLVLDGTGYFEVVTDSAPDLQVLRCKFSEHYVASPVITELPTKVNPQRLLFLDSVVRARHTDQNAAIAES